MTNYWLGKKRDPITVEKMRIGNLGHRRSPKTEFKKGQIPWNKGKRYATKFKPPGYTVLHTWLMYKFGKADCCENLFCPGICKKFHWALLKGKEYIRDRKYFKKLCQSCHQKYDRGNFVITWTK